MMLYWAAIFFIISLAAAILGFGGLAAGAAMIAKVLGVVFLALCIAALLADWLHRRRSGPTMQI